MKEIIREKRRVLRRFRKTVTVGADMTSDGRLFQRRHPATGNAQSLTVDSRVRRITSCMDDHDRRRQRLESATSWMCWACSSPSKLPLPMGDLSLHLTHGSCVNPTQHPKRHVDRVSCLIHSSRQRVHILYNGPLPPK